VAECGIVSPASVVEEEKKNIYFHSTRLQYKQDNCVVSSIIRSLHCPTAEGYTRGAMLNKAGRPKT